MAFSRPASLVLFPNFFFSGTKKCVSVFTIPLISNFQKKLFSSNSPIQEFYSNANNDMNFLLKSKQKLIELKRDIYRLNEGIQASEVLVLDDNGARLGAMKKVDAIALARKKNSDLIMIAENARPPVCRIMSYNLFKYKEERELKAKLKSAGVVEIKKTKAGIRFSDRISINDLEVKSKTIRRFLTDMHPVQITCRKKRARESKPDRAAEGHEEIFKIVIDSVSDICTVGKMSEKGNQMMVSLAPKVKSVKAKGDVVKSEIENAEIPDDVKSAGPLMKSEEDFNQQFELLNKLELAAAQEEKRLLGKVKQGNLSEEEKNLLRSYRMSGDAAEEIEVPASAIGKVKKVKGAKSGKMTKQEADEAENALKSNDDLIEEKNDGSK